MNKVTIPTDRRGTGINSRTVRVQFEVERSVILSVGCPAGNPYINDVVGCPRRRVLNIPVLAPSLKTLMESEIEQVILRSVLEELGIDQLVNLTEFTMLAGRRRGRRQLRVRQWLIVSTVAPDRGRAIPSSRQHTRRGVAAGLQ